MLLVFYASSRHPHRTGAIRPMQQVPATLIATYVAPPPLAALTARDPRTRFIGMAGYAVGVDRGIQRAEHHFMGAPPMRKQHVEGPLDLVRGKPVVARHGVDDVVNPLG